MGVSAGPDSMALLDMLRLQKKRLVVVHVNYHQRASAARDQKICEDYAERYKIPCVVYDAPESFEGNFQAFAREFRMNAFLEVQAAYQASGIYLAHHQDDQLETLVFQLLSKRQPAYLGMKPVLKYRGSQLIRPLLKHTKQDLVNYCHEHNITYGIDESNQSLKYSRNQIRVVLSDLDYIDKRVLLEYQRVYNERIKKLSRLCLPKDNLNIKRYGHWSEFERLYVLREFLENQGVDVHGMSRAYLKSIDMRLLGLKSQVISLDKEHQLLIQYGKARITSPKSYDFSVKFDKIYYVTNEHFSIQPDGPSTSALTLRAEDFPITVRNAREGDTIAMRYGTKRVSRFFIDRKIDWEDRQSWPVVENARGEVILVVGLGCDKFHFSTNPSLFVLR